jgi:hypothetical protein
MRCFPGWYELPAFLGKIFLASLWEELYMKDYNAGKQIKKILRLGFALLQAMNAI